MLIFLKNQIIIFLLVVFFSTSIALANETSDVIFLKNGTKVTGKIIKYDVEKEVVIKTESGTELQYKMSDVEKIDFKSESFYQYKKTSAELGVTLGTPAVLNLVLGKHFDNLMVKASGFYLGSDAKGIQFEIGYKLAEFARTYHAINIAGGFSEMRTTSSTLNDTDNELCPSKLYKWNYIGIVYNLNTNGFYLQSGLSIGEGDYISPQFMFQIGYVYQFRD